MLQNKCVFRHSSRNREGWHFGELIEATAHAESYLEQPRRHQQKW
jgi:hypothetical protein